MKLLVTMLLVKTKTISWDKKGINIGVNVVNAKGKYEKLTVYAALRYQLSDKFEGKKYYFCTQIRIAVFKQNNFKNRFSWFEWKW